jgi:hypothetical protein
VPTAGETYFTSASSGEIQILDKITTGTGVKECVVVLRCGGGEAPSPLLSHCHDTIPGFDATDGYSIGSYTPFTVVPDVSDDPFAVTSDDVEAYNVSTFMQRGGESAILIPNGNAGNYLAYPLPRMMWHKFGASGVTLTTTATVISLATGATTNHAFADEDDVVSGYIKFLCKGYYDVRVDVNYIAFNCNFGIGPDASTSSVTIEGYNPSNTVNVPEHPGGLGAGSVSYNFVVSVDTIGERLGFKSNIFSGDTAGYLNHFSVLIVPKHENII